MEELFLHCEQQKVKRRTASFILGGIFLAVSILLITACNLFDFLRFGSIYVFVIIFGALLVTGIAMLLIFFSKSINVRANGLLIIAFIMLSSSLVNILGEVQKIRQEVASEKMFDKIFESYSKEKLKETYSKTEYGSNAEILAEASKFLNSHNDSIKEYTKKIEVLKEHKLKLNDYTNKSKLEARIEESSNMIDFIDKYYSPNKKMHDKLGKLISGASVSRKYKQTYEKNMGMLLKNDETFNKFLDNEKYILELEADICQFLLDSNKDVVIDNGRLLFANQSEVDRYNELQKELIDSRDKEKELSKKIAK